MNQTEKDKFNDPTTIQRNINSTHLFNRIKNNPITLSILSISGFILYLLFRERQKQKELSKAPLLFFQETEENARIIKGMDTVLLREITPKFIVGTSSLLNSIMACTYRINNCGSSGQGCIHYTVREVLTIPSDGASIGIDWQVPNAINRAEILKGPISKPVLLLIHGYNNDTSTPYIRNVIDHCASNGFIVAGMNLRWCGNVQGTTPRGSTAAYTGDIRSIVQTLETRLKQYSKPLILIGYSLGANLITKYLGEESLANSLPKCIAAGISLGNPLCVEPENVPFPLSMLLTFAMRRTLLSQWKWIAPMIKNDFYFRRAAHNLMLKCWNITKADEYTSLYMIRNERQYPFHTRIGYANPNEYREDTRSYNHIRNISIPFLKISAMDDFLVHENTMIKLGYSFLANPNVLVCMTYTGGHLGWFDDSGRSWADDAVLSYVRTIVGIYESDNVKKECNIRNVDDNKHIHGLHSDFIYSKL